MSSRNALIFIGYRKGHRKIFKALALSCFFTISLLTAHEVGERIPASPLALAQFVRRRGYENSNQIEPSDTIFLNHRLLVGRCKIVRKSRRLSSPLWLLTNALASPQAWGESLRQVAVVANLVSFSMKGSSVRWVQIRFESALHGSQ